MSSTVLHASELAEEIDAINAIYEPTTATVTTYSSTRPPDHTVGSSLECTSNNSDVTTMILQIPNHPYLSFIIGFDARYPETPPRVISTASTGSRGEGKKVVATLEDIVQRTHSPGQVCLFDVINEAIGKFEELKFDGDKEGQKEKADETTGGPVYGQPTVALSLQDAFGMDSPPTWILSDVVTEKKSVFIGRAAQVSNRNQAEALIEHLISTDKRAAAATHNISAWRIREKRKSGVKEDSSAALVTTTVQDCDDDGETAAGGRLLHLMQLMDVWDVVVVVSRWYGGIKLGPDRFRVINNVGKDALIRGGFAKGEGSGASVKGKRKAKK
jgi:uncharacterized protein UPF0029/RWD domain-containing protein